MHQFYLYTVFFLLSCNAKQDGFKSPAGYDLAKPAKFSMPEALNEISGIIQYNDSLYAVQDEEGKLFYLRAGDSKAGFSKFGKKGDYEDLAIARNQLIILRSDGSLFTFPFSESRQEEIASTKEWRDLVPKGEYEGLYADEADGLLYVLCKQCKEDKKSETTSIFILQLQPDGSITPLSRGSLARGSLASEPLESRITVNAKKHNFHPSALAKNPRTQEWYILSSTSKMLVIADSKWNVKEMYPLDPSLFRQPEGIAFDRENNLYISNEGDAISNGNILQFVFNKTN
jgi:hypothetical protein